jgi:hypothetical protein
MIERPPRVLIGSARTLEYATFDPGVPDSGDGVVIVDGVEMARVDCLAISQDSMGGVLLLFCKSDWSLLAVAEYGSSVEAKRAAEGRYPGAQIRWSLVPAERADFGILGSPYFPSNFGGVLAAIAL